MIFTQKEIEIIEILESKDYATLTDFRRVYRDSKHARLILKRFTEILHILKFDVGDRFRINHAMIAKLLDNNMLGPRQVTSAKLRSYCDKKEAELTMTLSILTDPSYIHAKLDLLKDIRSEFQL